ncbi:MAG: Asp-tRNA(Asn)/Glu-tRNA(Gln) amidotransferase subunit GatC [Chloroflexota bacterium]|nr:Asp-tRNA(Asn)/Glu-tRNA(Gln) amidotransferase subunit GatC [Chloroflexota bacterium]MYD52348.1 Asp-tRNA(Asn)/Glu-tRNA(Gln) amidotransferase subunit GatC [Dehalococcoidia bacterium]
MALTSDEVRHIALLARVGMTDDEIEVMREQLSGILEHFQVLQQVDTDGVEPTAHSVETQTVLRDDEPLDCVLLDNALANAPHRDGDFVRVRAVLD